MDANTREDLRDAIASIADMMERSAKAQKKFAQGTSQHTLQKNRIHALAVASALIRHELDEETADNEFSKESLEKALAPIESLISKSEKAKQKLKPGTWQHTMLAKNLKALYIALPLVSKKAH